MKKKNIIKKLLSVALSAATVFSLLTLPAHAIVPGEDAYAGQEDGYICVNAEDYTTQFISKEDIPNFSYNSTYDALRPEEKARMESTQEKIQINRLTEQYSPAAVDDGLYTFVDPSEDPYSGVGVVLRVTSDEEYVYYKSSTGFLVNGNTLITSLHSIYDIDDNDQFIISNTMELRVYFGVDETLTPYQLYTSNHSYSTVSRWMFSNAVNTETENDNPYDWAAIKLNTSKTGLFFFNCKTIDSSYEGTPSLTIGYPEEYRYRMVATFGGIIEAGSIYNVPILANYIKTSNENSPQMSGGPIIISENDVIYCCGVYTEKITNPDGSTYSRGILIYPDMLNAILAFMVQ